MKGTSLIVSIVLFVAVAVLYVLHFTGSKSGVSGAAEVRGEGSEQGVRIAWIKADSLILNYDLAQDLHNEFTQKQEAFTKEYGNKRSTFEREAAEFQQKLQRGGFLTEQRAVEERDRLLGKEQEVMKLDQELSGKLAELQAGNNKQLLDSLMSYLKIYNSNQKYDFIFNAGDVLIGPEATNITAEVLRQMNQRYQANKPK